MKEHFWDLCLLEPQKVQQFEGSRSALRHGPPVADLEPGAALRGVIFVPTAIPETGGFTWRDPTQGTVKSDETRAFGTPWDSWQSPMVLR